MRRATKRLLLFLAAFIFLAGALLTSSALALSGSSWKANRVMDDAVFFNGNTMSITQIQNFLNAKVPTCDTNHAKSSSSNDSGPPYTCLKDYRDNIAAKSAESGLCNALNAQSNQTAAQIIYTVGKACGVSQKALIVLLQKEQGLVTDTWPWDIQYQRATGFGCPDTTGCNSLYYGFFNQVYMAARQFKKYQRSPTSYNFRPGFTSKVQYNPNAGCGGSNITMYNQTTAGLYNYTPYQPNAAALNNLYGSGDSCSAYGNRNFWRYYIDWFGSPYTTQAYAWMLESQQVYLDSARTIPYTKSTTSIVPGGKAYVTVRARNFGTQTWSNSFVNLGFQNRTSAFVSSDWITASRPAKLIESTVVPGEVGTFQFTLTAPNTLGAYLESYTLVAEGKAWMKDQGLRFPIHVNNVSTAANTNRTLDSGEQLIPGQHITSQDLQNTLILQKDGNVVLYSGFKARWSTGTAGQKASRLIMQGDGNLVLYSTRGTPLWHTETYGNPGAKLVMQTDGNMVVYSSGNSALWASATLEKPSLLFYVSNTLTREGSMLMGQQLQTPDRNHRLVFQPDGNVVLYSNSNGALWSTNTRGRSATYLIVQGDGNLVLYDNVGHPLWDSHTSGKGPSFLVMQQDGNLVLYDRFGRPTWNTRTNDR